LEQLGIQSAFALQSIDLLEKPMGEKNQGQWLDPAFELNDWRTTAISNKNDA